MKKSIVAMALIFLMLVLISCTPNDVSSDHGTDDSSVIEPSQGAAETTDEAPSTNPSAVPAEDYPLPDDTEDIGDCVKDAELIARLPVGEAKNSISFIPAHDNYEDDEGPDAFAIAYGKVYVLDLTNDRIVVYEDNELSFITFSDKDTHDHYTAMAICDSSIYLVGTTAGESQIAVYDMTGERRGSIPMPEDTDSGAYALYEEDGYCMLLTNNLEAFRLTDGGFIRRNGFSINTPVVVNGKIMISFNEANIELDAGECTALGVYRILNDRIYCIGYGAEVTYRIYDLDGEFLGESSVSASNSFYYPISSMFVSSNGELYVMTCMNESVFITKPHFRR